MKNIKTFLSGINNMLIYFFNLDFSKWRVLFDNNFIRVSVFTSPSNNYIIPNYEVLVTKEFGSISGFKYRLFITFRIFKLIIRLSFRNY